MMARQLLHFLHCITGLNISTVTKTGKRTSPPERSLTETAGETSNAAAPKKLVLY